MDVNVIAPSRLHLGLMSLGQGERRFGGVGLMVDAPALELHLAPAPHFDVTGPLRERGLAFATNWGRQALGGPPPRCLIQIKRAPPEHHGLGVGTQLALAIGAGLQAFVGRPPLSPSQLAAAVGRIGRSSIGTLGFHFGGLLLEPGRCAGEVVAPLESRVEPPETWRIVLMWDRQRPGLHGEAEHAVLGDVPAIPTAHSQAMHREAQEQMFPAAAAGDFDAFAASVYRYGQLAGTTFAPWQHSTFATPQLADRAAKLRALGIAGVAQSSWGPTLLAVTRSDQHAAWVLDQLAADSSFAGVEWHVTPISRQGARFHVGG